MTRILLSAVLALAIGHAGAVSASESYTFTGPTTNDSPMYEGPGLLGGLYSLKYEGDAELFSLFIEDYYRYSYDEYDNKGDHIDGEDYDIVNNYFVLPGTKSFAATTFFPYIPASGTTIESTDPNCIFCYEVYSYIPWKTDYSIALSDDPSTGNPIAGNFTFTISSIPEPKTWMLFMLGLGGVGYALRRWRSQAEVSVHEA